MGMQCRKITGIHPLELTKEHNKKTLGNADILRQPNRVKIHVIVLVILKHFLHPVTSEIAC